MHLLLFVLLALAPAPSSGALTQKVYAFDAGAPGGRTQKFFTPITPEDRYKSRRGYGWTTDGAQAFARRAEYAGTLRDHLTGDGVAGTTLGFRIDLPAGEWWFTFWLEVGFEDSVTARLLVNGAPHAVVWHMLKPDDEGRTALSPVYRVIHTRHTLTSPGFSFELRGGRDSVRLLGFTLMPGTASRLPSDTQLAALLAEAGRHRSTVDPEDLEKKLARALENNPADPSLFYWHQQSTLLAGAERLRAMAGWEWASQLTGVSIFDRMHQALMLLDANIENHSNEDNPFLERARWLRGKICYDLVLERGGEYQEAVGRDDLRWLLGRHPGDTDLAMLNGARIDLPDPADHLTAPGNAPRWAVLQREAIVRLGSEIRWWVTKRQAPNGELGGKIDDDVEILREWVPMLLFGDDLTARGWRLLADAVWISPRVHRGFSRRVRDVEHSSEFISDSTPELLLVDDDSTISQRLRFTPDHFENLWSALTPTGRRFFRSAWLGATEIDDRPPRNRDVEMNARALKPLRYLAWSTREPRYVRLCDEWARAWLSASLRTDKGKPAGIIPASVRWPDEAINGDEPDWYAANMMWDYYDWTHQCGSAVMDHLLFTHGLTGNDSLLLPIELALRLLMDQSARPAGLPTTSPAPGSEPWVARQLLQSKAFWSTVQQWRLVTHTTTFDSLLAARSTPYLQYRLSGDASHLDEGLLELLSTLRTNAPLRTELVVHTDRVRIPGIGHLKAMISGDATPEGGSPYIAVSWRGTTQDLALLVKASSRTHLAVEAFCFDTRELPLRMRPWRLTPGRYTLTVTGEGSTTSHIVTLTAPGQEIPVPIRPGARMDIRLDPAP